MNVFTPYPGLTSIRPVAGDPVRGLIADMARPPKALVPAPLVQKEGPTGYSYQQINCLDSIIRCVCVCVCTARMPVLLIVLPKSITH